MKFELRTDARYSSDEDLLVDLKRVAGLLKKEKVTYREYDQHGKFTSKTFTRRFGAWNNALKKAGLKISATYNLTDEELFQNLESVWRTLGQQPAFSEMRQPLSKYSTKAYTNRFGSWRKALEFFIKSKSGNLDFEKMVHEAPKLQSRYINEKTRLKILKRDNYRCVKCGRSPATHRNIFLHIDHIKPFSKNGDNSPENLQTLCNKCNLGKNNDENV